MKETTELRGRAFTEKKNILLILLFAVIAFVLVSAASLIFRQYIEKGYQYEDVQIKENELLNMNSSDDVLFFGDSIAWAAYSPEVFKDIFVKASTI